ncbi:S8 family peptidase [Tahibacter sp.]|uniref:S8 family peptidase n=1 Tax=Tahibacter sp. TaxID=2056211 RepID=UPI0028C4BD87|nr:S8 family peptidase [Tahibacter sp.]
MHTTRRLVEMTLYGTGDQRRYVQDGAVFLEVWIELIEAASQRVPLLLQPYLQLPPSELAAALHRRGIGRAAPHEAVYNNTLVSLSADLATVVFGLVPLTGWFRRAYSAASRRSGTVGLDPELVATLPDATLWADVPLHDDAREDVAAADPAKELLSFVRIAGVAAYLILRRGARTTKTPSSGIERAAKEVKVLVALPPETVRARIAQMAREGWIELLEHAPGPEWYCNTADDAIYSITCDRKANLAVAESRKTVKADAARRLFDLSCSGITWAVVDSGIDATHPAFARRVEPSGTRTAAENVKASRVRHTFDFSYLRDLLLGNTERLPPHLQTERYATPLQQVRERADAFKPNDWGLLRELLEVEPAAYYVPKNRHGTHVAGILGADWPDGPRGPMSGVCPDIDLIDVRICKDNGDSDEFIVTAALQFLRYLNAHADMMVVHGVNMSLSFEHDVASYACGRTPVCLEAERTVHSGIVVVAAAGNRGYRHIKAADESTFYQFCAVSITDPGNAEGVITVGSTHRREPHNFGVSYFSSRGPTGDGRIKPDLVAPGEKIYAPAPHGDAVTLDGTSMAAPHVSGAAALLLARNAELIGQPERIKKILCDTATDLGRERYFQGHGLVDALRALQSV